MMRLLLERLESGTVSAVLCIEPQRLTRGDLADCGKVVNAFRYTGTAVITPMKTYDLDEKYDRKMFQTELLQGNDYLEYTKEILQRGKIAGAKNGNYVGGRIPFGYRRVFRDERRRRDPTLEIVPEEAEAVRMMYSLYAGGVIGLDAIARRIDALGFPAPKTGGNWSGNTVRKILQSPTYTGTVYYGKLKRTLEMENGRLTRHVRTQQDYITVPNAHPAIVRQELFDAVQARFKTNPKTRPDIMKNPLAGLVRCGRCGRAVIMSGDPRRTHYTLYRCNAQDICRTHSTRYEYFYPAVLDALERELGALELQASEDTGARDNALRKRRKGIEEKLTAINARESRLMDLLESGVYSVSTFSDRRKLLEDERTALTAQLAIIEKEAASRPDTAARRLALSEVISICRTSDDISEINAALRTCISKIIYINTHNTDEGRKKIAALDFTFEIEFKL